MSVTGVLVEQRYLDQAQPRGLVRALLGLGHRVQLIDLTRQTYDLGTPAWCAGLDLVVCRGRSPQILGALRAAELSGVRCVNTVRAVAAVVNKAAMGAALAAGGVPTPPTMLAEPGRLARRHDLRFPLILKPIQGDNSRGLRVVHSAAELAALDWPEPVALVQRFLAGDGYDLKLYGAGERVWAVRRPSPIDAATGSPADQPGTAEPVPVTAELARLATTCGRIFGLSLFGVDCVVTRDGPVVIEVNDFPNYTGVAGADEALAVETAGH
jgi:glutathione synthase/RimK-type ligase-like ATP-grasp enzyme